MSERATTRDPNARLMSPEDEAIERAAILERLHQFAHATGAAAGDDVLRHFDGRWRCAVEQEGARRLAERDTASA